MTKDDQILTWMLVGAFLAVGVAYLMANREPEAAGQSDGGVDIESNVGLRSVPWFARHGHYGAYGTIPAEWEPHRMSYPRTPCQNLQCLTNGGMALNRPWFEPGARDWFADPPAESML